MELKSVKIIWKSRRLRIAVYVLLAAFLIAITASTPTFVYQNF